MLSYYSTYACQYGMSRFFRTLAVLKKRDAPSSHHGPFCSGGLNLVMYVMYVMYVCYVCMLCMSRVSCMSRMSRVIHDTHVTPVTPVTLVTPVTHVMYIMYVHILCIFSKKRWRTTNRDDLDDRRSHIDQNE